MNEKSFEKNTYLMVIQYKFGKAVGPHSYLGY